MPFFRFEDIKDKTWTVVGLAEDEGVPEQAMSVEEVNRRYKVGERDKHQKAAGRSQAIVDGVPNCYYPLLDALDAPPRSSRCVNWIEGERLAFGFFEVPRGYDEPERAAERELFAYVICGKVRATCDGEERDCGAGDIIHVPRSCRYRLAVQSPYARYTLVCSTPWLEQRIDGMTPEEAEQARLHMKPN